MKGQLKLQYGLLQIYEMMEFKSADPESINGTASYAVFDLNGHRVGRLCKYYDEVVIEAMQLLKSAHVADFFLAT